MKAANERDVEAMLTELDAKLGRLIRAVMARDGKQRPVRHANSAFEALVRAIAHQQMAEQAANAVHGRLRALGKRGLTPRDVLGVSPDVLRSAGLSSAKVQSVWNLATWWQAQPALADNLHELSNENVIAALTSVPGVGPWTANVFLIFHLQRPDVVPAADVGIRKGVQLAYGLDALATPEEVLERSRRWAPHRSLASLYLWTAVKLRLSPDDLRAPRRRVA